MNDDYFDFLSNIVNRGGGMYGCRQLLRHLYNVDFYSNIRNDDNRAEDGKKLREIFQDNRKGERISSSIFGKPCTVLEMLIGLSFRMENELEHGPNRKDACECFWILLKNLNIDWCNDIEYYYTNNSIERNINDLLERSYCRNGQGGLFPLERTTKDQRDVEIWYQMQEYLIENYF